MEEFETLGALGSNTIYYDGLFSMLASALRNPDLFPGQEVRRLPFTSSGVGLAFVRAFVGKSPLHRWRPRRLRGPLPLFPIRA
jgi:hypothetical protein